MCKYNAFSEDSSNYNLKAQTVPTGTMPPWDAASHSPTHISFKKE